MIGETTYKITVSRADSDVIKNLVDILENCPMGLNNDDYVEIMKTIAYHNYETDIEGVEFGLLGILLPHCWHSYGRGIK